jgi:hypothetical protein
MLVVYPPHFLHVTEKLHICTRPVIRKVKSIYIFHCNKLITKLTGPSNADNPALTPVIYDPMAPIGHRFSSEGIPATTIPRMYHSTASLTPNGSILLGKSHIVDYGASG